MPNLQIMTGIVRCGFALQYFDVVDTRPENSLRLSQPCFEVLIFTMPMVQSNNRPVEEAVRIRTVYLCLLSDEW